MLSTNSLSFKWINIILSENIGSISCPFIQVRSTTVNIDIFARYIFSFITRRAVDAQKIDVSENYYHNGTNRINWHVR